MNDEESVATIDEGLVSALLQNQFPQFSDLDIRPVDASGWDNRMFHLGCDYVVRLPSAAAYASQAEKEHKWLPKFAPHLPVAIPEPISLGKPSAVFPFHWSIYKWLPGVTAHQAALGDKGQFAEDLAGFLNALQRADAKGAPAPGAHNFFRGGDLSVYDEQARAAIELLADRYEYERLTRIWNAGLETGWQRNPVWVHGDFAAGNLLVENGRLCGVIDFGQLAAGDPACDLAIAWTFLKKDAREQFRNRLVLDADVWPRARGWALWKAMIVEAGLANTNVVEQAMAAQTISEILDDHSA